METLAPEKPNKPVKTNERLRSELHSLQSLEERVWKQMNHWLLWAGISPDSGKPMSHIGIYTDFT